MSTTLLEIRDERATHIAALEELLYDVGGDITEEEAAAAIDAWLAEADAPLKVKLDGYGSVIRERELKAAARKEEAARIAALAQTDANIAKRLKERLQWFFQEEGIEKMETDRFKFTLANNGGKAPILVSVPVDQLPAWAQRVTVTADTEALRGEIEAGNAIEGVEIGERGRHMRIR